MTSTVGTTLFQFGFVMILVESILSLPIFPPVSDDFSVCQNESLFATSVNGTLYRIEEASTAYNTYSNEYLVSFVYYSPDGNSSILAQRTDISGKPLGKLILIAPYAPNPPLLRNDKRLPAVVHNSVRNEYLVLWAGDASEGGSRPAMDVLARRLNGVDGRPIGTHVLTFGGLEGDQLRPALVHNPQQDVYLIAYEHRSEHNNTGLVVQMVDGAGQAGNTVSFSYKTPTSSLTQPLLAYHPPSNTFALVGFYKGGSGLGLWVAYRLKGEGKPVSANMTLLASPQPLSRRPNPRLYATAPSLTYSSKDDRFLLLWETIAVWSNGRVNTTERHIEGAFLMADFQKGGGSVGLGVPGGQFWGPAVAYSSQANAFVVLHMSGGNSATLDCVPTPAAVVVAAVYSNLSVSELGVLSNTTHSDSFAACPKSPTLGHANVTDTFLALWVQGPAIPTHVHFPRGCSAFVTALPVEAFPRSTLPRLHISTHARRGRDLMLSGIVTTTLQSHPADVPRAADAASVPPASLNLASICGPLKQGWNVSGTTTWTTTGHPHVSTTTGTGSVSSAGDVKWEALFSGFLHTVVVGGAIVLCCFGAFVLSLPFCLCGFVKWIFPALQDRHYRRLKFHKVGQVEDEEGLLDFINEDHGDL